ncbi:hypothetical protein [Methanogenium sp. MK-MG]|uniref:hypothetical protein n=1 Tax=Methanogenium sp. MK-MG TaxID=2599926 RepID=UPI0013ED2AD3|nr:hypothetical protein [Methanogenium sp. MK-MG]KAF1074385.1 hypothetical protein MKMG_01953 [Methanogenium sp. MK-MG]
MGKKEPITNTDVVEISRIDTFSRVRMFTGISSLDYHGDSTHDNARAIEMVKGNISSLV